MSGRGLVLGAGGVLGAAWTTGALQALESAWGWDVREADVLVGTSAGSVVAAVLGCGIGVGTLANHQRGRLEPDDPMIDFDHDADSGGALPPRPGLGIGSAALVARTLVNPRRFPPLAAVAAWAPRGRGTLEPVGRLVRAVLPEGAEWAPHPATWIVAMDYDRGRRVPFGRDDEPAASLPEAVMASCAIPGWYAAVTINGRRYVDGGTCSPTSADLLADRGLEEVAVLAPMASFDLDEPPSLVGRLERRFRRLQSRRVLREAAKLRRRGVRVSVLAPGREDLEAIGVNLMDPRRRLAVLETSTRTSAVALDRGADDLPAAG